MVFEIIIYAHTLFGLITFEVVYTYWMTKPNTPALVICQTYAQQSPLEPVYCLNSTVLFWSWIRFRSIDPTLDKIGYMLLEMAGEWVDMYHVRVYCSGPEFLFCADSRPSSILYQYASHANFFHSHFQSYKLPPAPLSYIIVPAVPVHALHISATSIFHNTDTSHM